MINIYDYIKIKDSVDSKIKHIFDRFNFLGRFDVKINLGKENNI